MTAHAVGEEIEQGQHHDGAPPTRFAFICDKAVVSDEVVVIKAPSPFEAARLAFPTWWTYWPIWTDGKARKIGSPAPMADPETEVEYFVESDFDQSRAVAWAGQTYQGTVFLEVPLDDETTPQTRQEVWNMLAPHHQIEVREIWKQQEWERSENVKTGVFGPDEIKKLDLHP